MDRQALKNLPRKRLQKLAQTHSVRANMKSEAIIKALLQRFPDGVPSSVRPITQIAASYKTTKLKASPSRLQAHQPNAPTSIEPRQAVRSPTPQPPLATQQDEDKVKKAAYVIPPSPPWMVSKRSQQPEAGPSQARQAPPSQSLGVFNASSASRAPWPVGHNLPHQGRVSLSASAGRRSPVATGECILSNVPRFPPGTRPYSISTGIPRGVVLPDVPLLEPRIAPVFRPVSSHADSPSGAARSVPVQGVAPPADDAESVDHCPVMITESAFRKLVPHVVVSATGTETDWDRSNFLTTLQPAEFSNDDDMEWTPSPVRVRNIQGPMPRSPSPTQSRNIQHPTPHSPSPTFSTTPARCSAPADTSPVLPNSGTRRVFAPLPIPKKRQSLATDEQLHEAVEAMNYIVRAQMELRGKVSVMKKDANKLSKDLGFLNAIVRQERAMFQRKRSYLDNVNVKLTHAWNEEDIWDKACPTQVDEDGYHMELDSDEEAEFWRKNPRAEIAINKWAPPVPIEELPNYEEENGPSVSFKLDAAPHTPKRRRGDEESNEAGTRKKIRGTPAPKAFLNKGKAADRAVPNLGGIVEEEDEEGEEEEERDIISVVSILTEPANDSD